MSQFAFLQREWPAVFDSAACDELGLTGTHVGCDISQCGCCTVHLDGRAVKSCSVLAIQANGASVVAIEGMAKVSRHCIPCSARSPNATPCSAASARRA